MLTQQMGIWPPELFKCALLAYPLIFSCAVKIQRPDFLLLHGEPAPGFCSCARNLPWLFYNSLLLKSIRRVMLFTVRPALQ